MINRIYHHFTEWEDYKNGLYRMAYDKKYKQEIMDL